MHSKQASNIEGIAHFLLSVRGQFVNFQVTRVEVFAKSLLQCCEKVWLKSPWIPKYLRFGRIFVEIELVERSHERSLQDLC